MKNKEAEEDSSAAEERRGGDENRMRVRVREKVEEGGGGGGRRDEGGGRREGRKGERGERRVDRERGVGMVKGQGVGIGIEEERGDVGRWRIVGKDGERWVWEAKLTSLDSYHYRKHGNGNRSWNLIICRRKVAVLAGK